MIHVVTIVFAFCSMIYELLLAQTLSATMGNSVLRYTVTIGFYIFALGIGALLHARIRPRDPTAMLIRVEIALGWIGGLSTFAVIALDGAAQNFPGSAVATTVVYVANHALILIIGGLSGLELPLLMQVAEGEKKSGGVRALVADYGGTLLAAVLFPLLVLPGLGVLAAAAGTALLNVLAALYLARRSGNAGRLATAMLGLQAALFATVLIFQRPLAAAFLSRFYFGLD